MVKKRIEFYEVVETENNVTTLGSLILDKRSTLGAKALIDLRNFSCYEFLSRDLLAALDEYTKPKKLASDHSFISYGQAIRTLLRFCAESCQVSEFRMRHIDTEFLLEFRSYVRLTFSSDTNDHRRRLYGNIERLIKVAQELGLVSTELCAPRNFKYAKKIKGTLPYTTSEALDIEDACRTHIRATLGRLDRGKKLLQNGQDPRARSPRKGKSPLSPEERLWNQLPNLLWFVVNVMDGMHVKNAGTAKRGLSSFNNATSGAYKGPYRKSDVFSYLYPFAEDLIPFVNLLAKTTGRNETSILTLSRDCLEEVDGRYLVWYKKQRGSSKLYKRPISNEGMFSPVGLIKTLLQITKPLLNLAKPEHRENLFLGFTIKSRGTDTVKPVDPSYLKYQMNRRGGWCDRNELMTENGAPQKVSLRRWRVYYLVKRYRTHGQLSKISRDAAHTLLRTSVSYVNNESMTHVHERATENGIRAALSVARPTVVTAESPDELAATLKSSKDEASKLLQGEQDVFIAACKDFYNRPNGEKNTPCDKPWACLGCSNAVITRHVLPRVVAFRDFISQQRTELTQEDWQQKFGDAWMVLHQHVLPKFSDETIAEAQQSAKDEVFYLPITLRA